VKSELEQLIVRLNDLADEELRHARGEYDPELRGQANGCRRAYWHAASLIREVLENAEGAGKSVEEYHANLARSFQQQDFAGPVDATLHVETGEEPEESLASQLAEEELTLKEKLVAARKAAGMSKADITKALGWKEKEVSRFERLDSNPTLAQIRYYAHAIGALVTFGVENGKGVGG
jgi:hypothetical protein